MYSYAQFCPVAKAAEIITLRWMPLVIRELLCGSHRFNDLHRGVPKMSRSLLVRRLAELARAGLVERRLTGADEHPEYHLTDAGEELRPIIVQLGFWGKRWVQREVTAEDLDAGLLMWDIQRRIDTTALLPQKTVVRFRFHDLPPADQDYWLIVEAGVVDLCVKDPGCEEQLLVRTDVRTFSEIWLGRVAFADAVRDETLTMRGVRPLRDALSRCLKLSTFA